MEVEEPQTNQNEQKNSAQGTEDKKFIIKKWHAVSLWTWGESNLLIF